tara:strand:+ start:2338 stop:3093 length:756 start_codon:yes stop_codon:yes gene_type:complete
MKVEALSVKMVFIMKKTDPQEIEKKFQSLRKIDQFLTDNVDGYLGKAQDYETYEDYKAGFGGEFDTQEKVRVTEAIKMHKQMVSYHREFGELPQIDMFSSIDWQDQIRGSTLASSGGVEFAVFGDIDDGQIMVHNKVSNTHEIIDFDFEFDANGEFGHIKLSPEGSQAFPKLAEMLEGVKLVNGGHPTSLSKSDMDHLNIDGAWLKNELSKSPSGPEIVREISDSTGPRELSSSKRYMEKSFESEGLEMGR